MIIDDNNNNNNNKRYEIFFRLKKGFYQPTRNKLFK